MVGSMRNTAGRRTLIRPQMVVAEYVYVDGDVTPSRLGGPESFAGKSGKTSQT